MKNSIAKLKKFWKHPPDGRFLSLKEIFCFGGSGLGVNFILNVIVALITVAQIPEIYQIGVMHGTYIFIISNFLGLIAQMFFGKLLQNTNTKWGKYKPYILFLAPVVAAFAVAATWLPQNLNEDQRILFAYLTCIPALILWNIWSNTFNMMPAVVTPNQQERADVWAPLGLVINFAPTIVNVLKGFIVGYYNRIGKEYMAYRLMGIISIILGFSLVLLILKVKERVYETKENTEKVELLDGLKQVLKNKPLIILTLALMLGCLRSVSEVTSVLAGKIMYSSEGFAKGAELFSTLSLIVGFAATPNMLIIPFLTRKFNNRTILIGWQLINTAAYVVLYIIGYGNLAVGTQSALVITIIRFFALFNAMGSLIPLLLSEIYDYQQWKTGKRLEGFIQMFAYSLVSLTTQFALLIPAFIQQKMGFEPKNYFNVTSVSSELMKTATDYFDIGLLISIISGGLMMFVLMFYKLDKKTYTLVVNELKERAVNIDVIEESILDENKSSLNKNSLSIDNITQDTENSLDNDNYTLQTNYNAFIETDENHLDNNNTIGTDSNLFNQTDDKNLN